MRRARWRDMGLRGSVASRCYETSSRASRLCAGCTRSSGRRSANRTSFPLAPGGWFRGKDPNVAEAVLRANWVENASVLYIGKAGDPGKSATLRSRLTQYLKFGDDKAVGHWGGRYIWQLADAQELCVAWKPLPDGEPSVVETALIAAFSAHYGRRPFANLRK